MCAIRGTALVCYEPQRARPIAISDTKQTVIDFSIAPDGGWVVYRTFETLYMAQIGGDVRVELDKNVPPPSNLTLSTVSLTWSPDSLGIAYLTPTGFKTLYPGKQTALAQERAYHDLRWSPGGTRLAAQATDGSWTFFESAPGQLKALRTLSLGRSEMAWLDENAVVIAPITGGLSRFDPARPDSPAVWYIGDELFIRLQSARSEAPGEAFALHLDARTAGGSAITGNAVSIRTDGKWSPFGTVKLDSRLEWAAGKWLVYVTSGTPILADRATGEEDSLPIREVGRLAFGPAAPPSAFGISLDADLYFLAGDARGVIQLWRLPANGSPLTPITRSLTNVTSFAVGERIDYQTVSGLVTLNLDGTIPELGTPEFAPTALTPFPTRTPRPPTATPIPVTVQRVGWQPGPAAIQRVESNGSVSRPALLESPQFSPTGRFAAGTFGGANGALVILEWSTGRKVTIGAIVGASKLVWVQP
jgi:hypothetical protein